VVTVKLMEPVNVVTVVGLATVVRCHSQSARPVFFGGIRSNGSEGSGQGLYSDSGGGGNAGGGDGSEGGEVAGFGEPTLRSLAQFLLSWSS